MNDQTNGIMAFILHVTPPASFIHHQTRFPTVRGTWFDVDLETLRDGTAEVTLVGVDERTYQLRAQIPVCGSALHVAVAWTREYVMLRLEGREVARVKTLPRPEP